MTHTASLTLYRTAPQSEARAAAECRRHGIKAYPVTIGTKTTRVAHHSKMTRRSRVIAAGYLVAGGKPYEAVHVKEPIGRVLVSEIASLTRRTRGTETRPREYLTGTAVRINRGPYADISGTVVAENGAILRVEVTMFGRRVQTAVHKAHVKAA